MNDKDQQKWYFKTWFLIISFLLIGPFMLSLVWTNQRFSKQTKIIISVIIIALTYFLILLLVGSLKSINSYYQLLSS